MILPALVLNTRQVLVFPAHAGVIPLFNLGKKERFSFSRTRGGDPISNGHSINGIKFFPHTRGWSRECQRLVHVDTVFPAHAGVILDTVKSWVFDKRFSRTRGGDPEKLNVAMLDDSFFPHTRGWSHRKRGRNYHSRVFPAHAGVIPLYQCSTLVKFSFSRTRGGDSTNLGHMEIRQYQSIGWGLFLDLLISWLLFKYCRCKQHILKIEML